MKLAEKFKVPPAFIDTLGADPGGRSARTGGGHRGESARDGRAAVPVIVSVVWVAERGRSPPPWDRVYMLEHAVYSVISPEGCAAILGRRTRRLPQPAAMKITAQDLKKLAISEIVLSRPAARMATQSGGGALGCSSVPARVQKLAVSTLKSGSSSVKWECSKRGRLPGWRTGNAVRTTTGDCLSAKDPIIAGILTAAES
jgi:hypothetical protein